MYNYNQAVKIGLRFHSRFWEDPVTMKGRQIFGGASHTDLPIRQVLYPSYGMGCKNCTGILVVYPFNLDGMKFVSIPPEMIEKICLDNLRQLHGDIVLKEYTGQFFTHRNALDPFIQGSFAFQGPGQFSTYFRHLIKPEMDGHLHLAGEAIAYLNNEWIVGALNSAYRSVYQILKHENLRNKIKRLKSKWGPLGEPLSCDEDTYFC